MVILQMHNLYKVWIDACRLLPHISIGLSSNGSWRSIWNLEFKDDLQLVEVSGKLQVPFLYVMRFCWNSFTNFRLLSYFCIKMGIKEI